jgi:hypothetical protein
LARQEQNQGDRVPDSLSTRLASRPREVAGSVSSNRFDYQKDWAICALVDLFASGNKFLLLLDYHEDVVILDSHEEPTTAVFFQIKTMKSGNWTVRALTRKATGKSSILEKLYTNHHLCGQGALTLRFASNQGLSCKLVDGSSALGVDVVQFSDLSIAEKERIHRCLEGPSAIVCCLEGLRKIQIERSFLPLVDHAIFAKGKVAEFLDSIFPGKAIPSKSAYLVLFDEVRRRTNEELTSADFSDFAARKGIGRDSVQAIINLVADQVDASNVWTDVSNLLTAEGIQPRALATLRSEWRTYLVQRMDVSNTALAKLAAECSQQAADAWSAAPHLGLNGLLEVVRARPEIKPFQLMHRDSLIDAVILYEAMRNEPIPSCDPKPQEEAK